MMAEESEGQKTVTTTKNDEKENEKTNKKNTNHTNTQKNKKQKQKHQTNKAYDSDKALRPKLPFSI